MLSLRFKVSGWFVSLPRIYQLPEMYYRVHGIPKKPK